MDRSKTRDFLWDFLWIGLPKEVLSVAMSPVVISVEAVALSGSNRWLWLILPVFEKSVRWRWVEWFGRFVETKSLQQIKVSKLPVPGRVANWLTSQHAEKWATWIRRKFQVTSSRIASIFGSFFLEPGPPKITTTHNPQQDAGKISVAFRWVWFKRLPYCGCCHAPPVW